MLQCLNHRYRSKRVLVRCAITMQVVSSALTTCCRADVDCYIAPVEWSWVKTPAGMY